MRSSRGGATAKVPRRGGATAAGVRAGAGLRSSKLKLYQNTLDAVISGGGAAAAVPREGRAAAAGVGAGTGLCSDAQSGAARRYPRAGLDGRAAGLPRQVV